MMLRTTVLLCLLSAIPLSAVDAAPPEYLEPGVESATELSTIHMPYNPCEPIPCGWKLVTIKIPVIEICTKTVCEKEQYKVAKQVPCMETKQVDVPTEIYKTYIVYKKVAVEDGVFERRGDAPGSVLDELERKRKFERPTDPINGEDPSLESEARTKKAGGQIIAASTQKKESKSVDGEDAVVDADKRTPITKIRKKTITIQVPVKKIVEVDQGCWKEIVVSLPCPCPCTCDRKPCRCKAKGCAELECQPETTQVVRKVWVPNIVKCEVTVLEACEQIIDEPYTDYIEPKAAPAVAPTDTGPATGPDVLVTEDRIELIPQYVTKAERSYVTRTIQVPSTRTVYQTLTRNVTREVPYEVTRIQTRQILVPIDSSALEQVVVPSSVLNVPFPADDNSVEGDSESNR